MDPKKRILLYFFCLNTCIFLGQNKNELSEQSFDAIRDSINKYMYSNHTKAIEASTIFMLKAKKANDKEREWLGIESIGSAYLSNREIDKAQTQFEKALYFAEENNLEDYIIRSYFLAAEIQLYVPNASKALELLNTALALAEKKGDKLAIDAVQRQISHILQISGNVEKAIEIRKKTIALYINKPIDSTFSVIRKNQFLINSYDELSNSYIKIKQADSSKHYLKLMSELIKPSDSCSLRSFYLSSGELDFINKDYASAKINFRKGAQLCDKNVPLIDLNISYDLGKVEYHQGNYNEAKRRLQQGLNDYKVTPSEEGYMDDYYKLLADSYKETGDFERANYYFEKYINSTSEYSKLKSDVETSQREKEIAKFRSELKKLELEKNKKNTYLNYLFLGASLIILALLFVLLKFYRNKKANDIKFEALLAKIKAAEKPENIIDTKDEVLEETNTSDVSEEVKTQILDGLKKLEEKEYFLKQDCSSYNVAKKIGTNTSYLSKVINSHYGKNFNTYINDLRINYAIVRLKNDVIFRSYSIQSIAEEIGYKSADSFTRYFKKDTGLNPSFYIKEIKNVA